MVSRRDFHRVWEGWEAGFMAFHAFHTLSFPRPAFRSALLDKPERHPAPCAAFAKNQDPRPLAQTARDKDGVPGLLSFTSWAATPAAQALRGDSTQRAGRSVLRYAR
jgi:hypothetical protein